MLSRSALATTRRSLSVSASRHAGVTPKVRLLRSRPWSCSRSQSPRELSAAHGLELTPAQPQAKGHGGQTGPSSQEANNAREATKTGSAADADAAGSKDAGSARRAQHGSGAYQPGQEGEQQGASGGDSPGTGEGVEVGGKKDAPAGSARKYSTWARGFATSARARYPDERSAKEQGGAKEKDVKGAQNEHLKHSDGKGDEMPAVKNNAALPSQQGSTSQAPGGKKSFSTSARSAARA